MGGIELVIYRNPASVGGELNRAFYNIKNRGPVQSTYITESTIDMTTLNPMQVSQLKFVLSRAEIIEYERYFFDLGSHRLCINDMSHDAMQPFENPIQHKIMQYPELRKRINRKLIVEGNIYNYNELIDQYKFTGRDLESQCDLEVVLPLYIQMVENNGGITKEAIEDVSRLLNGDFAFILVENLNTYVLRDINIFAMIDYLGKRMLYYAYNEDTQVTLFASEIKAFPDSIIRNIKYDIQQMPIGSYWSFNENYKQQGMSFNHYYTLDKYNNLSECKIISTDPETLDSIYTNLYDQIVDSVVSKFVSKTNSIGILLSGGFDSNMLAYITAKYLSEHDIIDVTERLYLFTIGDTFLTEEDLDDTYATKYVKYLQETFPTVEIVHHIIYINDMTIIIEDIEKIIYTLETYDPTVIREAIPLYYLCKYIKENTSIRLLLSGEGLDELVGDYNIFETYDDETFQEKTVELLQTMCKYNLLKNNKILGSWGLDVSYPYLDKSIVEYILELHPKLKRAQYYINNKPPIRKYIIRKAFEHKLPNEFIWRDSNSIQKALTNLDLRLDYQFKTMISDIEYNVYFEKLLNERNLNKSVLPLTKEELYYRQIFDKYYPNRSYLLKKFLKHMIE